MMRGRTVRVSAVERLWELPEVFTLSAAASLLGCEANIASNYLARWKKMGLVTPLGPRAAVYFNLLRDREGPKTRQLEAVACLFPGAMIGGVSAIHAAGWTTQIPSLLEVFVIERRTQPKLEGFETHARSLSWFKLARNWLDDRAPLPYLDPAFALADAVRHELWRPDPDEIEWDQVDVASLDRAFQSLRVGFPSAWDDRLQDLRDESVVEALRP